MIVIRNLPSCSLLKEKLPCLFIHSGICEKSSDMKILNSGTYVIKKRCPCKNQENQENQEIHHYCDCCGSILARQRQQPRVENRTIQGCNNWCDLHATNGQLRCNKIFKQANCQGLCIIAVLGIQQGCHWCCTDGAFYDKCVEPFADILSKIPSGQCDPEWD